MTSTNFRNKKNLSLEDYLVDPVEKESMVDVAEVQQVIGSRLHNFSGAKTLAYAWNTKENVMFFGPGGYGGK